MLFVDISEDGYAAVLSENKKPDFHKRLFPFHNNVKRNAGESLVDGIRHGVWRNVWQVISEQPLNFILWRHWYTSVIPNGKVEKASFNLNFFIITRRLQYNNRFKRCRSERSVEGSILSETNLIHGDFESMNCSEESQLTTNTEQSCKYRHGTKAKMARFPRIVSRRAIGFLQRKERFTRQPRAKKRVKYNSLRQESEENLPDIFSEDLIAREGASNWNINRRESRRMATCEQLEKITSTCDGKRTLYDLRKALVVVKRLENYGLL